VKKSQTVLRAKDRFMARKLPNRLDLRRQREAAEPIDPMEDEPEEAAEEVEEDEVVEKKPKKKAKAPAKSRTRTARSSKPAARMRIVWVVLNDAFKPVGTPFDYSQKEAADARAAELTAKGKGAHFVQRTKEAMPEDAPGLGASIPRVITPAPKASKKAAAVAAPAPVEDEEEIEEEDDGDVEVHDEADDDDE
jgi:hypothetical protein